MIDSFSDFTPFDQLDSFESASLDVLCNVLIETCSMFYDHMRIRPLEEGPQRDNTILSSHMSAWLIVEVTFNSVSSWTGYQFSILWAWSSSLVVSFQGCSYVNPTPKVGNYPLPPWERRIHVFCSEFCSYFPIYLLIYLTLVCTHGHFNNTLIWV